MSSKNRPMIKDYIEYTNSFGEILKIYAVPTQIISGIVPKWPKPQIPKITMQTRGGTQDRLAKEGDPEYESYKGELEKWEQEKDDIQEALTFCLALRDIESPETITINNFPPHIKFLFESGDLKLSDNPWINKFMWLRSTKIGQHDEYQITMIINRLSGIPEDVIDEMKQNFRNILLGKTPSRMGVDSTQDSKETVPSDQE